MSAKLRIAAALVLPAACLLGCGEKAMDKPDVSVETPIGDVTVDADSENGTVTVDVDGAEAKSE